MPMKHSAIMDALMKLRNSVTSSIMLFVAALVPAGILSGAGQPTQNKTVLAIDGTRFTLNETPIFLVGISYYGGLGAPDDFLQCDLDDLQRYGFNWLRVWATWSASDQDVSAVTADGHARQPFFSRLEHLVAECNRRGLVVDVTLSRGQRSKTATEGVKLPDLDSHRRAVETIVTALKPYRNWYLDLANERDVRDQRYVSIEELKTLRDVVRRLDPPRLVTASFGGHDLSAEDLRGSLLTVGVDFVCPHRPRHAQSPGQTEAMTRSCLAMMKDIGRMVPVHYQEPFRRGYGSWQPAASEFLADLRGAQAGGAAGWCFHNGQQQDTPDGHPHRSFDLHEQRLFDQLDAQEREVIARIRIMATGDEPGR